MEKLEIVKGILDSYPYNIIFVNNDYIISFMNKKAEAHYRKGQRANRKKHIWLSQWKICWKNKGHLWRDKKTGKDVFIFVNSKNQRVYMQGVKNEKGEWDNHDGQNYIG